MAPKNRPNIWLVIWVSLAILLYLPFIAVLVLNIVNNSAHPNTVWIGDGQLLPEAYFAMFWFSGLLLWRHFMAAIGFPSPPSAWLEHTLHTHIAVQSPFHLTWLYPPTMGLLSLLCPCISASGSGVACTLRFQPLPCAARAWHGRLC